VPFAKDLMSLDDVSGGRFTLGVGAGGVGFDAVVTGGQVLPPRERVDRLTEFVELLDALLSRPVTTWAGRYYEAVEARMHPGCLQQPRLPFVVAANGPRAMRVAARFGQGWATTGVEGDGAWWDGVAALARRLDEVLDGEGRARADIDRYLSLDSGGYALESVDAFEDAVGRAAELGFTDVVTHWPRPEGVYAGSEAVLEKVAARLADLRRL
jgi:alkanesulfonate monooxygenase SsuD/methylene tetrahydromethanopterin reductase-like flavin-dependent oxidoreductase (luciferase family)